MSSSRRKKTATNKQEVHEVSDTESTSSSDSSEHESDTSTDAKTKDSDYTFHLAETPKVSLPRLITKAVDLLNQNQLQEAVANLSEATNLASLSNDQKAVSQLTLIGRALAESHENNTAITVLRLYLDNANFNTAQLNDTDNKRLIQLIKTSPKIIDIKNNLKNAIDGIRDKRQRLSIMLESLCSSSTLGQIFWIQRGHVTQPSLSSGLLGTIAQYINENTDEKFVISNETKATLKEESEVNPSFGVALKKAYPKIFYFLCANDALKDVAREESKGGFLKLFSGSQIEPRHASDSKQGKRL